MEERLLQPADVARRLGLTPSSVRLLVRNQQLRVFARTLRGGVLFRAGDVEFTRQARLAAKVRSRPRRRRPMRNDESNG
jgi:hypothetical protein